MLRVLLVSLVYLWGTLQTSDCKLCDSEWRYHSHTKSCMKLFRQQKSINDASSACRKEKGNDNNKAVGHLVYILDKETNDFVKNDILESDTYAFIGLNDRLQQGNYRWGLGPNPIPNNGYFQWEDNPHNRDIRKTAVIITKDGWREHGQSAYYICQMEADIPQPSLTCKLSEVGKRSPEFTCKVKASSTGVSWMTLGDNDKLYTNCSETSCRPSSGYEATVEGTAEYSSTLVIKDVSRSDEKKLVCTAKLEAFDDLLTTECDIKVVVTPEIPTCSHEFTEDGFLVSCTTSKVYPEAKCRWQYHLDTGYQGSPIGSEPQHKTIVIGGQSYFQSTCQVNVNVQDAGLYKVKVTMSPDIKDYSVDKYNVYQDTEVTVVSPQEPVFYTADGSNIDSNLEAREDKLYKLTCQVSGGNPKAKNTKISCDTDIYKSAVFNVENRNSAMVEFIASRKMHGKQCKCETDHITYNKIHTETVSLDVKFAANITRLQTNPPVVDAGAWLEFRCVAEGNPLPTLTLYRSDDKQGLTKLKEVTRKTYLSFQVKVLCNETGKYSCLAGNDIDKAQMDIIPKIRCPPEHCDWSEPIPSFGAVLDKDVTVEMCVFAYPEVTNFQLSTSGALLPRDRYETSFKYLTGTRTQGEISLTIRDVKQSDLGEYSLYAGYGKASGQNKYLKFRLVKQAAPTRPVCPKALRMTWSSSDLFTLTWKPEFNGGMAQTFIILKKTIKEEGPALVMIESIEDDEAIGKVNDTQGDIISYDVTGLSPFTTYVFRIDTENEVGSTECPDTSLWIHTKEFSSSSGDAIDPVVIIIPVTVIVIVLIIILAVLITVVVKRRRNDKSRKDITDSFSMIKKEKCDEPACVYAEVDKSEKNKGKRDKTEKETKKKDSKPKKKSKTSAKKATTTKEEESQIVENMYAEVVKKKDKATKETKGAEGNKGHPEVIYHNTVGPEIVDVRKSPAAEETVYANSEPGVGDEADKPAVQISGRTVNQEGLVYVTVEIADQKKTPEVKSKTKKTKEDRVEYVEIMKTRKPSQ